MKRALTIGVVAAVTAAGLSMAPAHAAGQPAAAAQRAATTKADPNYSPADRAAALRSAQASAKATAHALRLSDGQELKAADALRDTNGATHVRYERTYQGLRVIGGDLIVHRDARRPHRQRRLRVVGPHRPQVDHATSAKPAARSHLVVFAAQHRPVLAWETRTRGTAPDGDPIDKLSYVSARTGKRIAGMEPDPHGRQRPGPLHRAGLASTPCCRARPTSSPTPRAATRASTTPTTRRRRRAAPCSPTPTTRGATAPRRRDSRPPSTPRYGAAQTWDFYKNTFGRNGIKQQRRRRLQPRALRQQLRERLLGRLVLLHDLRRRRDRRSSRSCRSTSRATR